MLYELYANNFAIMKDLRLTLGEGMNAITGETGAGKTLIIDALSLLLGARSSDSYIRSGCEKCLVEGVFLPPHPKPAESLIEELGFDPAENLILSRELVRGGKSVARINSRIVNLTMLRNLGRLLVNIHGQSEHMLLLEDSQQLFLLDSFGQDIEKLLSATYMSYQMMQQAKKAVAEYEHNKENRAQRIEELKYLIDELTKAELLAGEDEQLAAEANLLAHGEQLYQLASDGLNAMTGTDAAIDMLRNNLSVLKDIANLDPKLANLATRQENLFFEAEDISRELTLYRDRVNLDAFRMEEVQTRLAVIEKLKKKYQASIDELLVILEDAKNELISLEEISLSGDSIYQKYEQAQEEYSIIADKLSATRKQAAQLLGDAVSQELKMLNMPAAIFRVDLPENPPSDKGNEHALFSIQTNIGEPFQPVAKIASGGELSRIVLGIKVILSQLDTVPTLIFDEVDTGLSGKAVVAVAERIAKVGEGTQVIVISHNAVMAAAATHQIVIAKYEEAGRTVVDAKEISGELRVAEISRMIAGDKAGEITYEQAREMISQMSQQKQI